MESNKNIFCVSNPAKIMDGLWRIMCDSGIDLSDMLIFLPSRRAVRSVEKMIVERSGHAVLLPRLVALGEGFDQDVDDVDVGAVSTLERVVAMAYLLSGLSSVRTLSAALPVARSLVTMQDYLENSDKDISDINWSGLVDEKYAKHFQDKAQLFGILQQCQNDIFAGRESETKHRNKMILGWIDYIKKLAPEKSLVIVCGSTASVPVTRKLMRYIASIPFGRIILSGKISGSVQDFSMDTNPYNSEYMFLSEMGLNESDVTELDVGTSNIDFMNRAFGNDVSNRSDYDLSNCHLVECNNEAEEAATVSEIAKRSIADHKTVLVITPDAAANQRLMSEFLRCGIVADFSGGVSGTTVPAGRAILNLMDEWIESGNNLFDGIYTSKDYNLFDTVSEMVEKFDAAFAPKFTIDDEESIQVWNQIQKLSDCLSQYKMKLSLNDARAFIYDCLSDIRIRGVMNSNADVIVLGTIESRMQTADVVILTGLNEGMFPATGYENPWLPRAVATAIGVPSPNHKVSLMAMDFMNLSCNSSVFWLRSRLSGSVQTQESRFLSRVIVAGGVFDKDLSCDILAVVRNRDVVESKPLNYDTPVPPADWSDVFVTELENLIHNPYLFYVRHILRLRPENDYWAGVDARDFGNLVHSVLENAKDVSETSLIAEMDRLAIEKLGHNNLIFHFWHRRFIEIAPMASKMLSGTQGASVEISGQTKIANRTVRARADRIWDGGVLDIKTGMAPGKTKLLSGVMPQLPLEALMLKNGGFKMYTTSKSQNPIMQFLQLKSGDVRIIEYDSVQTSEMINAAVAKVTEAFNMYCTGDAGYPYYKTGDAKYKICDDFARADERD